MNIRMGHISRIILILGFLIKTEINSTLYLRIKKIKRDILVGLLKDKKTRYSNIMLGYVPTEIIEADFSLRNFVKISKIDAANSKELPGATLEITNVDDSSKKYSWVSTNTPHAIYLENGKYKLCETIAPKGYTLKTECINFTVDGKKIISVTMENDTTITPPNTGMFSSKSIYIIGGLLIVIGFSTIVIIYNKKQRLS